MTQFPPPVGMPPSGLPPHRGTMILVFGILGVCGCTILGIIAWVMGSGDVRAMREGRMDPSGMGNTNAGRICGMIGTIIAIVVFALYLIGIVFFVSIAPVGHMR